MFYNYVFNGLIIDSEKNLYNNIYITYGLKKKSIIFLKRRVENELLFNINTLDKQEWIFYLECIFILVPYKFSLKKRTIFNIYLLDIITCYRGWRHYKGLPVRGQRTWTNSWSCYKSNWILRNYKFYIAKKDYNNVPLKEIKVASIAEFVNCMWKQQWDYEWFSAKNSRLQYKGNKNTIKIDIYAMANYQIIHPLKLKNLSKKQKQSFKKNYFSLGFDVGFTKILMQEIYNSEDYSTQSVAKNSTIFKDRRLNKKNSPKKKSEINKKNKKVKKSVWD